MKQEFNIGQLVGIFFGLFGDLLCLKIEQFTAKHNERRKVYTHILDFVVVVVVLAYFRQKNSNLSFSLHIFPMN